MEKTLSELMADAQKELEVQKANTLEQEKNKPVSLTDIAQLFTQHTEKITTLINTEVQKAFDARLQETATQSGTGRKGTVVGGSDVSLRDSNPLQYIVQKARLPREKDGTYAHENFTQEDKSLIWELTKHVMSQGMSLSPEVDFDSL